MREGELVGKKDQEPFCLGNEHMDTQGCQVGDGVNQSLQEAQGSTIVCKFS